MDWKEEFKKDVKVKLKASEKEYKKYKQTSSIIYLQQACNKLFSAVENYLMVKYKKRVRSYKKLRSVVKGPADKKLLRDAAQMHYFYYNGRLQMEEFDAADYYNDVRKRFERILSW